ncbi:dihydroorotase [Flavobacteriales bacterium]|jgi:dihydroorotase|nr:dihydroorotase [Flavobacteriales bacterium]MBT4881676.1 dihydroorotase [Flavobacteriales bacterium]MDC3305703.1 dihydroorotase [Flavobacteriales bacterium]MDC3395008.1 dihydroorotase [Flavobacteriales bacterium]
MLTLIKNAQLVNEGRIYKADVLIKNKIIKEIATEINIDVDQIIDAEGLHLIPGVIDDQVHFREPGLTHKANIYTESKAAVAGGITSFMEMPNTNPQALTQELLEDKYQIAEDTSIANYSFFMGASNDNLEEVLKTDPKTVGAIKIFMGSSTGNMLVDNKSVLEELFKKSPMLIAVHCEDEATIQENIRKAKAQFGEGVPISEHPNIRSAEACYKSSSMAVELAKKHNTRLHVFHLSTEKEIELFDNTLPLAEKRITAEICIHHLWFDESKYEDKGTLIKWNPAVKKASDKEALFQALLDDKLDVIATDHAPHTLEEKSNTYFNAPSGGPLVQHALPAMLAFVNQKKISLEKVVEKMCHNPAICFQVENRGFIREGYFADLVLVDLDKPWEVTKDNILYKCGWSPFEGETFNAQITHTFVNGHIAYEYGSFDETQRGMRLTFDR